MPSGEGPASVVGPPDAGESSAPPAAEEGGPVGPDEDEETSFRQDQVSDGPAAAGRAANPNPPVEPAGPDDLPPLEELVQRIPAPTRALIDEMFRAKFVAVKRLPRSAFKSEPGNLPP